MAIYVMTGGSTGIGAATRRKLLDAGHEVFNIDYRDGDFSADLSTSEGCERAIAEVLSDMDAEIEALEAKRAKYESIKQGMMQELLTGKTRLKG